MALTDKLTALGDAIRAKTGDSKPLSLTEMATAVSSIATGGGGGLTEEQLTLRGNCQGLFKSPAFNWYINDYGDQIKTKNITMWWEMFSGNQTIEVIPFDFNFASWLSYCYSQDIFSSCINLKRITGSINGNGACISQFSQMFWNCNELVQLPTFNIDFSYCHEQEGDSNGGMFGYCYSLRKVPEELLRQIYSKTTNSGNASYYFMFYSCYDMDEIKRLGVERGELTDNAFYNTFGNCSRLKDLTFDTNEDGTPYVSKWTNQQIDLTTIGYGGMYNINPSSRVIDVDTYNALKNTEDWYSTDKAFSRYNHNSAVNTINSLPDTSAYGGVNTITFKGESGSSTDGGAINTMTEEEIAVATAKGWTVSFV